MVGKPPDGEELMKSKVSQDGCELKVELDLHLGSRLSFIVVLVMGAQTQQCLPSQLPISSCICRRMHERAWSTQVRKNTIKYTSS